ncbi:hypothetical protein [Paludifilum halophilum]|uniref:Uncharacterized protein n=1 Tax=Paludifilum halophilum TaxID=1642702 RepID=A0A235BAZ4_9BACL|nr:hypothetical protein [Paludifilum halophilum]OYD09461.1 hypothetical protein CHM34_00080 [Paludifilum halophilum]
MNVRFQTPHQYVFVHENVKHLLLVWSKEAKKQLFLAEEEGDSLHLKYPGETYAEMVLDQVEPVFFRQLEVEDTTISVVLGATFHYQGRLIGMYYNREQPDRDLYFFALEGDRLEDIPDEEYEGAARTFLEEFPEYIGEESPD